MADQTDTIEASTSGSTPLPTISGTGSVTNPATTAPGAPAQNIPGASGAAEPGVAPIDMSKVEIPTTKELPQATPMPANPLTSSTPNQNLNFGGGTRGAIGTVATLGSSILKGYMQGREYRRQKEAAQSTRLVNGLQWAYQGASEKYLSLLRSGADPSSKDVKEAQAAADASGQALLTVYGRAVAGTDGGKSKAKKGKSQAGADSSAQADPLKLLGSADPNDKIRGWVGLMQKTGMPHTYQAQAILQQRQQLQNDPARQHQAVLSKLQYDFDRLSSIPNRTPQQEQELQDTQAKINVQKELAAPYKAEAGNWTQTEGTVHGKPVTFQYNKKTGEYTDLNGVPVPSDTLAAFNPAPKPSSVNKPGTIEAFFDEVAKESGISATDISAESTLQLRRAWSNSARQGIVSQGHYFYIDKDTGKVYDVPITRSTSTPGISVPRVTSGTPGAGTGAGVGATMGAGTGEAAPVLGTATPRISTSARPARVPHMAQRRAAPSSTTTATVAPPSLGAGGAPSAAPRPGRVIGQTMSEPTSIVARSVVKAAGDARRLTAALDAADAYMSEIKRNPAAATPRKDLDTIVSAVRAMNPGRSIVPQTEFQKEFAAGSAMDRLRRYWYNASRGTLPPDQRQDLYSIIRDQTTANALHVVRDWRQFLPNMPLPSHLQRFAGAARQPAQTSAPRQPSRAGYGGSWRSQSNAAVLPDEARKQLKEGHVTVFRNGERWMLHNGQPVQMQ